MRNEFPPLAEMDHAQFDAHYLRAFDQILPPYFRPILNKTPYSIADITQLVEKKLFSNLPSHDRARVGQHLQSSTQLYRTHIAYIIAQTHVHAHTGNWSPAQCANYIRGDLMRVVQDKILSLSDASHPLFAHYKARPALTTGDLPMKVMDARVPDQKIATWLHEAGTLERIVSQNMPELLALDPDTRIVRYMVSIRAELREFFKKNVVLFPEDRQYFVGRIIDDWTCMQTKEREKAWAEIQHELSIDDVTVDDSIGMIGKIHDYGEKSPEHFKRVMPLLEQVLLHLSTEDDDRATVEALGVMCNLSVLHGIPLCDHPTLGIAALAVRVQHLDRNEILPTI